MQVVLSAINSKYIHTGLGLRYVGEYAKVQGHEVTLIEETINTPILAVLEKIMAVPAQVYGFSVHIWNKSFVFKLIRMLRKLRPQAAIVIGGPEVAFDAEKIFAELPQADYIVQGEGELVFSELLQYLAGGGAVPKHIAYREGEQVNLNGGITVIDDMSLLPFPYPDLEKMLAEHKIVYYECTRGCPFNCAYCLSGISRSVRKRPLELVLRDLDRFIAAGVPLVKFVDRTYNLDEKYFLPMMEHLAQADTNATFHFEIKADILSEQVMDFLATVPKGRFQLEIGIQSTHQPTLKAINRQDNWEKLSANVKRLLSFGNMHIHVDLIAGLPYEDLPTFAKSFDDVYGLGADMLQLGFLKVLPGTQMRRETEKHDLRYMDEPPYEILATKYMPYEDMLYLKHLDNILDQTANSGGFKYTVRALLRASGMTAFAFYRKLTQWWVKAGFYPQTHNAKGVAAILKQFIEENYADNQAELLEILRFDVFCEIVQWRPEWLKWQTEAIFEVVSAFWRDEEKVRRYIPAYKFSSWRQIHKLYPIELFKANWETGNAEEIFVMLDNSGEQQKLIKLPIEVK
ncbi:B12-binding domain-containing radical SAM protein [Phascolarctobacterium sp.]|uniref:B12-binding domain-containing radical SAM protein n=2 Tax=Phascolarctobacterium TaxID=33024 RepID=UPI0025FE09F3|nr:B12-binding domain-containing radical SAM protein [Phascolarctobacterium sp.]